MSFACLCTKTFVETYTSIPSCHSSKHGSRANLGDGNVIRASRYAIKCYMTTDFTAYSRVYFLSVLRFYSVDWLVDNSPRRPPILPHTLWDLWWTKWQWDRILFKYFGVPLKLPFHNCDSPDRAAQCHIAHQLVFGLRHCLSSRHVPE